ncbi:GNAT family N-acetyltransferase [Mobilicoccus massiliensis]|uniref:GNAT family N-acetyltransferase n=1 Tax=Mobilicoccus massiliensis TaxID=1522310 RepID=UPI0005909718|nr:GNAT family N-acetyltransferase [Mobilicoccus massiliensis]
MSDLSVRVLSEDEWEQYRDMRLRALRESPDAFVADIETEEAYDEQLWRDRMNRSDRLVVTRDSTPVGIASVRMKDDLFDNAAELFSLWVDPKLRGEGVAARLVVVAGEVAEKKGASQLVYWVGTDNVPAVAFASSYGFRPTEHRREPRTDAARSEGIEEEIAMVLALRR